MPEFIQAIVELAVVHETTINQLNIVVTSLIVIILSTHEILRVSKDPHASGWVGVTNRIAVALLALFAFLILVKLIVLFVLVNPR